MSYTNTHTHRTGIRSIQKPFGWGPATSAVRHHTTHTIARIHLHIFHFEMSSRLAIFVLQSSLSLCCCCCRYTNIHAFVVQVEIGERNSHRTSETNRTDRTRILMKNSTTNDDGDDDGDDYVLSTTNNWNFFFSFFRSFVSRSATKKKSIFFSLVFSFVWWPQIDSNRQIENSFATQHLIQLFQFKFSAKINSKKKTKNE